MVRKSDFKDIGDCVGQMGLHNVIMYTEKDGKIWSQCMKPQAGGRPCLDTECKYSNGGFYEVRKGPEPDETRIY